MRRSRARPRGGQPPSPSPSPCGCWGSVATWGQAPFHHAPPACAPLRAAPQAGTPAGPPRTPRRASIPEGTRRRSGGGTRGPLERQVATDLVEGQRDPFCGSRMGAVGVALLVAGELPRQRGEGEGVHRRPPGGRSSWLRGPGEALPQRGHLFRALSRTRRSFLWRWGGLWSPGTPLERRCRRESHTPGAGTKCFVSQVR